MVGRLVVALAAGGAFAVLVLRAGVLTRAAAWLSGVLAASIVGLGGIAWALPALLFFGSSAALSRLPQGENSPAEAQAASRRTPRQVLANGGVAWALLLVTPWAGEVLCYWGFVGAFAAAAADTWATEIGSRSGGRPCSLRTLRRVHPGTSGAVTPLGTLAALGGAAVVAAGAAPYASHFLQASPLAAVLLVTAAGFAGALADSVAGAFWQARYREEPAGPLADSPTGPRSRHAGGAAWLGNDEVNVLCTAVGAAAAMGGVSLFG